MDGQKIPISRTMSFEIKKGWKAGTKLTFKPIPEFPKSVIIKLKEAQHSFYERRGDDLKWKCRLSKNQITKGVLIRLPTLDGKVLTINTTGMHVRHGDKKRFAGQGMPISRTGGESRGDLIIKFIILP